jgi:predicted RNase H-like HicB family nuclease
MSFNYTYPAIFHKEEGVFWVEFPDLPGCYTTGDDISAVMESAQEALGLYLATQIESEVEFKPATDIKVVITEDEDAFISFVACDVSQYLS